MQTKPPHRTRKTAALLVCAGLAAFLISGCASKPTTYSKASRSRYSDPTQAPYVIKGITYYPIPDATGFQEKGLASWYGEYFHGRPTSNGERYDMYGMTAAHKILPMNTLLRVRNLDNGKETVVRINDRGPFIQGRVIDLSYTAAQQLDIVTPGTSRVEIVAISDQQQPPLQQSPVQQPPVQTVAAGSLNASKPADRPSTKTSTAARRPESPKKTFYVQVGSFSQMENALKLKKRFTDAGHVAMVQREDAPTQPSYQVHVFAGREITVAKKTEAALLEHGYSGAILVSR